jgi:hypothetical protein
MNYLERIKQLEEQVECLQQQLEEHHDYDARDLSQEEHHVLNHSAQCYYDRWDDAQERLERGEICPEQAAELRMGA